MVVASAEGVVSAPVAKLLLIVDHNDNLHSNRIFFELSVYRYPGYMTRMRVMSMVLSD